MKKTFTGPFGRAYGLFAVIGAVFLFMLCSALPDFAIAEEAGTSGVGYVSKLEGKADITRAGSDKALPARQGDKVFVGDVVRTKPGSKAELTFNDKTVVRLAPETRIKVDEYLFNPEGGRKKASLYLFRGKVRGVVSTFKKKVIPVSISESTFNIQTPTAIAGVRGTDLFVFYLRGTTGVVFNEGLGFVYNPRHPAQVVDIRAGQSTFILNPEAPPLPPKRALNIEFLKHSSDTAIENGGENGADADAEGGEEGGSGDEGTATTEGTSTGEGGEGEGSDQGSGDNGIASFAETGSESLEDAADGFDTSSRGLTGLTSDGDSFEAATEYSDTKPFSETESEALDATGSPGAPVVTLTAMPVVDSPTGFFEVNTNEPVVLSYYIDGVSAGTGETDSYVSASYDVAEGWHTIEVTATDSEGLATTVDYIWFYGERFSDLFGLVSSQGVALDVSGDVALLSDGYAGGWYLDFSGSAESPLEITWPITLGGTGRIGHSSPTDASGASGYWVADIVGTYADGIMSGTAGFDYLTLTSLITGTGTVDGSFDSATGAFSASAWGGATEYNLSFVAPSYSQGLLRGLMGSTSSIWGTSPSSPAPMIMIGKYFGGDSARLWLNQNAYSVNFLDGGYTTYDGGAFYGYSAMLASGGSAKSSLYSLYIDPSGNAGVLTGELEGSVYSDIGMMKMEGAIFSSQIKADADIPYTAGSLLSALSIENSQSYSAPASTAIYGAASSFTGGSAWDVSTSAIAGQDWGVLESSGSGTYTNTGPVSGALTLDFYNDGYNSSTMIVGARGDLLVGADNTIDGGFVGYGARQDSASSWISAGEFLGTFSPVSHTWQSIQTGAWIETGLFISMTQSPAGQASLQALNIPYAEVGRANLTGTDGNLTVNMNDVTFFAYSSGAASKVWATNNITGSYVTDPLAGASVALSGNGLSSSFNVKQWSTSTWLSSISGAGTYSGTGTLNGSSVNMVGAAAGTYSGGAFSGTGAGTTY